MVSDESEHGNDEARPETNKVLGREPLRAELPKRFYATAGAAPVAGADGEFQVELDGRPLRTPKKLLLKLPTNALAVAIAAEWQAQGARIDPASMPLTRLANVAIDAVAEHMVEVRSDIEAFAASDLLCYRATMPETLVQRQHAYWDPILAWAEKALGAKLVVGEGVMPVTQAPDAIMAIGRALADMDEFRLAALHVMTTLLGSAILSLAHAKGRLSLEQAWAAANVDEMWQAEQWGRDAEAEARQAYRYGEFAAASRLVTLLD